MIDNNCGVLFHAYRSFENDVVIMQRVGEFLDLPGAISCELVCRTFFKALAEDYGFWAQFSREQGVPLVAGNNCNRKQDFLTLRPLTLSGARISQTIGEFRGEIPCISREIFNKLPTPDPFEQGKCMADTWMFVVVPDCVIRIAGVQTPLDFDGKGNLVEVPEDQVQHGKELVVSLTLKNLELLCFYPLKGQEHMPVFSSDDVNILVLDQCGASAGKIHVYFMRKQAVEKSRAESYFLQKQQLGERGFDDTSILTRTLGHAINILEFGKCLDGKVRYTYCPDIVNFTLVGKCHTIVGGFVHGQGLRISSDAAMRWDQSLVAPCIPADVFQR